MDASIAYQRILLKISGEMLKKDATTLDQDRLAFVTGELRSVRELGVGVAVVIGAGNIFRGGTWQKSQGKGDLRAQADQLGMLATTVNACALALDLAAHNVPATVLGSVDMPGFVDIFSIAKARQALDRGDVLLLPGGLGHPYFSTDTASAVRALEVGAQVMVKATQVDGVYDKDPRHNPDARRFDTLAMSEAIRLNLKVMDQTAFSLCRENGLPILVGRMDGPGSLAGLLQGQRNATLVTPD